MLVDTGGVLTVPRLGAFTDGIAITTSGGESAITRAVQEANQAGLPAMIEKQAAVALEDAQTIIFVVDGQVYIFNPFKIKCISDMQSCLYCSFIFSHNVTSRFKAVFSSVISFECS